MTTVSEGFAAAEAAAMPRGNPAVGPDSPRGVYARDTRVRIPVTESDGKGFVAAIHRSWVWRESPPPLRDIIDGRTPDSDSVPSGHGPLRLVWLVWNSLVAVPATAVCYVLAWLLQHPARALALAAIVAPITFVWINN